eukprot:CAMPEP_0203749156 /NCGR_PEP_ID=MMETSP0098-20131031/3821_1 /ASSEMBLY_ACC=CAM_ASM_000208 /TAXON_ID=96639 /ORGANISM=" , Strain NY0313808BC1" /LENGTH=566 /DNA_ID=CAMNT_0050638133 /DNA_START=581 /DNA_END=2281 /DNA_ORIENTATION=-
MMNHSRDRRWKELREQCLPRTSLLDDREVHKIEDLMEPPSRFHKKEQEEVETKAPENFEPGSPVHEEDDEVDDVRDVKASEHLDHEHPRGMEPGAQYLRSADLKTFASRLGSEDWSDVHERVLRLGCSFAKELRQSYERKLVRMNKKSIFHSDANKLRMEAQLQVELRRELKYSMLERSVLMEMMGLERMMHAPSREQDTAELKETFSRGTRRSARTSTSIGRRKRSKAAQRQATANKQDIEKLGALEEEDETLFQESTLLSFDDYKKRAKSRKNAVVDSSCIEIEEYLRARVLGFRRGNVRVRRHRKGKTIGEGGGSRATRVKTMPGKESNSNVEEAEDSQASDSSSEESNNSSDSEEELEDEKQAQEPETPSTRRKLRQSLRRAKVEEGEQPELVGKLVELFGKLEMPPEPQLDFLIRYTPPEEAMKLNEVVVAWEKASEMILLHERTIAAANLAKARKLKQDDAFTAEDEAALQRLECFIPPTQMFGAALYTWIEAILDKLSIVCKELVSETELKWGHTMSYRGHPYLRTRFGKYQDKDKATKQIRFTGNGTIVRLNPVLLFD